MESSAAQREDWITETRARASLADRLDALDLRRVHPRPGADAVERLRACAAAVDCSPVTLAHLLGEYPDVRSFVVWGPPR